MGSRSISRAFVDLPSLDPSLFGGDLSELSGAEDASNLDGGSSSFEMTKGGRSEMMARTQLALDEKAQEQARRRREFLVEGKPKTGRSPITTRARAGTSSLDKIQGSEEK